MQLGHASNSANNDTIAAIATPPGKGGVGIVRLSGPQSLVIAKQLGGRELPVRTAVYTQFKDQHGMAIDTGLSVYFACPHSFTGEDVVELHGHGGPVIQDLLLQQVIQLGARQARAGEFSERAFLNDKIDLTQAEAISDLIESSTAQAARGAMRSLQGEFSNKISELLHDLVHLRMYVEAAIDFPEEEIDFLADATVQKGVKNLQTSLRLTIAQAGQGRVLRNGLTVVLAGKPNAGKSSLLNALAGHEAAIVTDIAGTTRDTINVTVDIDGLPVHLIDTAGLRESDDEVEKIGVARAQQAIQEADHVVHLIDVNESDQCIDQKTTMVEHTSTTVVYNKLDLLTDESLAQKKHIVLTENTATTLFISATQGHGISDLKTHIKNVAGYSGDCESLFTARRRHLTALQAASDAVDRGMHQLTQNNAGELLADELLQAQNALNEITGEFSADDLLGEIFSGFCIGK